MLRIINYAGLELIPSGALSIEKVLKYTPGLSTVYGLFMSIMKAFVINREDLYFHPRSRIYHQPGLVDIDQKSYMHCIALIIPLLGNIALWVSSYVHHRYYDDLNEININCNHILKMSPNCPHYRDLLIAAIKLDKKGTLLQSIFDRLKDGNDRTKLNEIVNDAEILEYAIFHRRENYRFAGEELKKDKIFAIKLLKKFHEIFEYFSIDLKENMEILRMAVTFLSSNLEHVKLDLTKHRGLALEWIETRPSCGENLFTKQPSFGNDEEIVMKAVGNHGFLIDYAGEEMKKNKRIGMQVVKDGGEYLEYLHEDLRDDIEIVRAAFKKHPQSIQYASIRLRGSRELFSEFVQQDGLVFAHASDDLKKDKSFVIEMIQHQPVVYSYIDKSLKKDQEVLQAYRAKSKVG